jgi:beta-galactosidase
LTTLEALLLDDAGLPCLDARNVVRFSVAGDAHLLDNLGTVGGSRVVQLANGRAWITLRAHGNCIAGISSQGLPSSFLTLSNSNTATSES